MKRLSKKDFDARVNFQKEIEIYKQKHPDYCEVYLTCRDAATGNLAIWFNWLGSKTKIWLKINSIYPILS